MEISSRVMEIQPYHLGLWLCNILDKASSKKMLGTPGNHSEGVLDVIEIDPMIYNVEYGVFMTGGSRATSQNSIGTNETGLKTVPNGFYAHVLGRERVQIDFTTPRSNINWSSSIYG